MRKLMPVLLILIAGCAGALLRSFQLQTLIDTQHGLLAAHPANILLIILCAAAALMLLLMGRQGAGRRGAPSGVGAVWLVLEMIAGFFLICSGLSLFLRGMERSSIAIFIYGLLSLLYAFTLLYLAKVTWDGNIGKSPAHGFIAVIGIFWCCLAMVLDYYGHAGDPNIQGFIYPTLAVVFLALALIGRGGFFYGRSKPTSTLVWGGMALLMSCIAFGGLLIAMLGASPDILWQTLKEGQSASDLLPRAAKPHLDALLRLGFILFHAMALMLALGGGAFQTAAANSQKAQPKADIPAQTDGEALTEDGEDDIL